MAPCITFKHTRREELRFRDKVNVEAQRSKVFGSFTPEAAGAEQKTLSGVHPKKEEVWAAETRSKIVDNAAGGGGEEEDRGEKQPLTACEG